MQSKVKMSFYFSLCKFYVAARGFERENRFYPAEKHATTPSPIRLYYTPVGALRCKYLRIANAERQTPPATLYGTSHMSSVEPVSRKRVRSVGAASSNIAATLNEYTWIRCPHPRCVLPVQYICA